MKSRLLLTAVSLACTALAAAPLAAAGKATRLQIPEPAFHDPVVTPADAPKPGFELQLARDMPSTGWRCDVDSVHVEQGRIYVELTEAPPEGMAAQVITKTRCTIPLGELAPGRYLLELWLRRGNMGDHYPAHALILQAI
jgi:hypothetical protein